MYLRIVKVDPALLYFKQVRAARYSNEVGSRSPNEAPLLLHLLSSTVRTEGEGFSAFVQHLPLVLALCVVPHFFSSYNPSPSD